MRFEEALSAYHDEIYRYLFRLCLAGAAAAPAEEAADLTQDTFERAYQAYDGLKPDSNVRAWLYAIAGNAARDRHKRRQREAAQSVEAQVQPSSNAGPELALINSEQQRWLLEKVAQLPHKQRQALTLRYLQELDYDDISQVLSCSAESARANVYQALQSLRAAAESMEVSYE